MAGHPYNMPDFACSFEGLAEIRSFADWGAYFRVSAVPAAGGESDAMMLAPRLPVPSEEGLAGLVQSLRASGLVSAVFIPDPLSAPPEDILKRHCDIVRPFKTHYICDASRPLNMEGNHRKNIRYAGKRCHVREIDLGEFMPGWMEQWTTLCALHGISGWGAFSRQHFEKLAEVRDIIAHGAFGDKDECMAISLWARGETSVSAHLSACSEAGYKAKANYALYAYALEAFRDKAFIDFGGNSGQADDPQDGLSYFKSGFSNHQATSMLCGLIIDDEKYKMLSGGYDPQAFFPAYRAPGERP